MSGISLRRRPKHGPRHDARAAGSLPAVPEETSITDDLAELEAADAAAEAAGIPAELPVPAADPREEMARYLDGLQRPSVAELTRLLDSLRAWDPNAPAAIAGRPALPALTAPQPVLEPEPEPEPAPDPVPGAAVLLAIGGTPTAPARLDGMPERRTVGGQPVLHLGDDPEHPGEAFAIGSVSDAWLDALIVVATEERDARLGVPAAPRKPTFTPHDAASEGGENL